jgi:hypothetical protein
MTGRQLLIDFGEGILSFMVASVELHGMTRAKK